MLPREPQQPHAHLDHDTMVIQVLFPDDRRLVVTKEDVRISHFSSGHGGQNVNRHLNGVQLNYWVPNEFRRPDKKTQFLTVRARRQRSLEQNMKAAFSQLADELERYFYVPKERIPTKMSKRIRARRRRQKEVLSRKKRSRGRVASDE